jgi:hypothetical protein
MALMGIERVADMSGPMQTCLCEWLEIAQSQAHTLRGYGRPRQGNFYRWTLSDAQTEAIIAMGS